MRRRRVCVVGQGRSANTDRQAPCQHRCEKQATQGLQYKASFGVTSNEVSLAALYLFAILTASWNCGIVWGVIFAILALGGQIAMGMVQGHPYSTRSFFFQAQANLFFGYCVAVFLTTQLRSLFER